MPYEAATASAYSPTSDPSDKYVFEMSRLLKTNSTKTDAQLEAGQTIGFGVGYWDPNFTEDFGWNAASHYVTGCSQKWMDLILATDDMDLNTSATSASSSVGALFGPAIVMISLFVATAGYFFLKMNGQ